MNEDDNLLDELFTRVSIVDKTYTLNDMEKLFRYFTITNNYTNYYNFILFVKNMVKELRYKEPDCRFTQEILNLL
jgi:hypothetical protein